jgi:hypothetical protein
VVELEMESHCVGNLFNAPFYKRAGISRFRKNRRQLDGEPPRVPFARGVDDAVSSANGSRGLDYDVSLMVRATVRNLFLAA